MLLLMPFVLAAPLLLLAEAVVTLWAYGPLGWLGAVLLLVAVVVTSRLLVRRVLRWWAGTKAPVREVSGAGRGPVPAVPPAPPAGTSRG